MRPGYKQRQVHSTPAGPHDASGPPYLASSLNIYFMSVIMEQCNVSSKILPKLDWKNTAHDALGPPYLAKRYNLVNIKISEENNYDFSMAKH